MSRLLVFGDLHCDRSNLRGLVERAFEERCDALVSLGDLCYLPRDPEGRRFLRSAGALPGRAGLELLLVDGNYDDAEALALARAHARPPPARYRSAFACITSRPERASVSIAYVASPTEARFLSGRLEQVASGTGPWRASGPPWSASPAAATSTSFSATTRARSSKVGRRAAPSPRSPRSSARRS